MNIQLINKLFIKKTVFDRDNFPYLVGVYDGGVSDGGGSLPSAPWDCLRMR